MKHPLIYVGFFFACFGITLFFQNCGGSSIQSNPSLRDDLTVDVSPNDSQSEQTPSEPGDPSSPGGDFSFNLNNGDNIFFQRAESGEQHLATSRLIARSFYTLKESSFYELAGTSFATDLPMEFCTNSALPHCAHLLESSCNSFGCFETDQPVRCHQQRRMTEDEVTASFTDLNSLSFVNRTVLPDDPAPENCNDPLVSFFSENQSLTISLAERTCVPDGDYYATSGSAALQTLFNGELGTVDVSADFCNLYSSYNWSTTQLTYKAESAANVPPEQYRLRQVRYENQQAEIRFQDPGEEAVCARDIFVNPPEIDELFPDSGLEYQVSRFDSAGTDLNVAEVRYEDPVDGGAHWHFFLNEEAAHGAGGGPILTNARAQAMAEKVEVLVERAKTMPDKIVECE